MKDKFRQQLFSYLKECEELNEKPILNEKEILLLYHEVLRLEKILGMVEPEPVLVAPEDKPKLQDVANHQWQQVLLGGQKVIVGGGGLR